MAKGKNKGGKTGKDKSKAKPKGKSDYKTREMKAGAK
jgi:hypothetical protein